MTDFLQHTIAMVYDFDGTLSPKPMQEYTVLPKIGMDAHDFWAEVNASFQEERGEAMLTYMRLLLEKADAKGIPVGRADFADMGKDVEYFPGVEGWFDRINAFVAEEGKGQVRIEHYIISAGLIEILKGISIYDRFTRIYASEYYYGPDGVPKFPKLLITDTTKTQFLFRINKGKHDLTESINQHMEWHQRPVPFQNMIYIGDGLTDVPSMTVVQANGGHAMAVYKHASGEALAACKELLEIGRVNFIAPADYSEHSPLESHTKTLLRSVMTSIAYEKEKFACLKENGLLREQKSP
jgi:hypothetical protein